MCETLCIYHSDLVPKSVSKRDAAKIATHKALSIKNLPIPKGLDDRVNELRKVAQTRSPARWWLVMQENYPELIPYLLRGSE